MKLIELFQYKNLKNHFIAAFRNVAEERIFKMSKNWNRGNFCTDYILPPFDEQFFIAKRFNGLELFFYEESEKDHFPFLEINYGGFGLDPYIVLGRNFYKINEYELKIFFEKTLKEEWTFLTSRYETIKVIGESVFEKP